MRVTGESWLRAIVGPMAKPLIEIKGRAFPLQVAGAQPPGSN
jgi:hypothetical protein